jgi:hypothetical protein
VRTWHDAAEAELRRVVHDEDLATADALNGAREVRRQNPVGRHALVPEEAVNALQLTV